MKKNNIIWCLFLVLPCAMIIYCASLVPLTAPFNGLNPFTGNGTNKLALIRAIATNTSEIVSLIDPPNSLTSDEIPTAATDEKDIVSLTDPPAGVVAANGDGTDETDVIQAIFDYATKANKTILIPKNYTFVVDNIYIGNKNHFSILGYGTLKHKNGATNAILDIENCSNFYIDTLNTNGNVANNKTDGQRLNEDLASVQIIQSHDFKIDTINDKNPAGDSLYLNDVDNASIGTLSATAKKPSGRNALTIIKAQDVTIDKVLSQNIGVPTMPSGICLEPNSCSDDIENVVIKSAEIKTSGMYGCAVGNHALANVNHIEINANITRDGTPDGTLFVLNHVDNFKGNITCNQEGTIAYGAVITACNYVDANLEIYNSITGLDVGKNSSNINLTGKIIGTAKNGMEIYEGLSQGVIDMDIKQVAQEDSQSGVIRISPGQAIDNLTFKGDYSFDKTGGYCFRVDWQMTNCRTEDLNMSGWTAKNMTTGADAGTLAINNDTPSRVT
ncbi:MAG: hypothetical protein P4L69_09505 [Desulfosporosinus sp.]|nr:hypothetical protein [Desulfosporosinus sp.]